MKLIAAIGIGLVFGVLTYGLRWLNRSGAVAGGLLAATLVGMGWAWAVPGVVFFTLSSLLSKVGRARKAKAEAVAEKGSTRDAGQVLANGGVAWLLLVIYVVAPAEVWYVGFLGAFAAATADTWATEVGTLLQRPARLVTTGRRVPPGTSGAVSLPGTLAAAGGALVIGLSAEPFAAILQVGSEAPLLLVVVTVSGFAASFVDSLLGATLQARFRDPTTGNLTENPRSATGANEHVRGLYWLRNGQVNVLCTLAGATLAMACFQAL